MTLGNVLFISVILGFCNAQLSLSNCDKETCEECIQQIDCAWCSEPILDPQADDKKTVVHCRPKNETALWCPSEAMLESPKTDFRILQSDQFSNDKENPTQIMPQRVRLALRRGQKHELKFRYKIAANYPVDLYYVMDLSNSMKAHKDKLAQLGSKLAMTMRNITTNFQLGFGSFIDKVELPFTSTRKERLRAPCDGCASPYSFKNHMPLSVNYAKFVDQVRSSKVSGNLDTPEGGLDAIMQAIVCKKQIKWRPQARHLLILSTDAGFHIAGDGKLAGVVEPNNGKCHAKESDYLKYDYPSVSHINHVARENHINIIFAIVKKTNDVGKAYKELSKHIENSNFGELNEKDDNNVINLVVDNYNKISQTVKFTSNADSAVDVSFSSNCNNIDATYLSDRCNDVHVGDVLEFTATIQPRECFPNGQTKILYIRPDALNETLQVELEVLCNCSCSMRNHSTFVPKSDKCSTFGDMKCGICDCSEGRFGRDCQCDSSQSTSEDVSNCIMTGSTEICSGSGQCRCGKCECNTNPANKDEKIYGKYCQCDNYSCKKGENDLLCSGRGDCDCSVCKNCQAGYTGDACQCEVSEARCTDPQTGAVCSGRGRCVCGRCECNMDENRYSGQYCEDCISCPAQRCEELRHCVECQAYKSGIYNGTLCDAQCTTFTTEILDTLGTDDNQEIKKCRIPDNDRCIINFEYYYDQDNKLVVRASREKICAPPPNVLAWSTGVIGTIIIAGLILLLVWKICTTIHDRREYAKFENEQKKLKWSTNGNPLYREATTNFANPAYQRSSVRMSDTKRSLE
ncbi:unnamed protein product [Phaedon cochleariae]|uniref:Integrin beta n=1 Tax=Phaedon cochleariae TaxID=80249 RepID=A0A9P0GX30_PHACE|nr:unnamed protein product [Phaedon cochleariae]